MLKYFHQGKIYDYKGPRDTEHLLAFARGGYKEVASVPVPEPPTFMDIVKAQVNDATESVQALYYQIMREVNQVYKGEKPLDAPFIMMMAMVLIFFILVLLTFAAIFTGPKGEVEEAPPAPAENKKNK